AAFDAHGFQRRRKNFSAAVDHQQFVPRLRHLRNLPRQRSDGVAVVEQSPREFHHDSHATPAFSSKPIIRFRFCTACPAAPLPRLSRQLTIISRCPPASSAKPTSQKFVYATCCSSGRRPACQIRTIGLSA